MTTMTPATKHNSTGGSDAILSAITALYAEPEWLTAMRAQAWDAYQSAPLPSRVAHLWRYTDPADFVPADVTAPSAPKDANAKREFPDIIETALQKDLLGAGVHIREGLVWKTALDTEYANAGVKVLDLHEAAQTMPDLVRDHLGKLIGSGYGKFEALNTATWTDGLLVYVPRGVCVDRPVHIISAQPHDASYTAGRLLIIVESGAELTLVDEFGEGDSDDGHSSQVNRVVEIFAADGSRVKYVPVQNWGHGTTSHLTQRSDVGANAVMEIVLAAVGSSLSKVNCGSLLTGKGAESNIFGLAIGGEKQHYDHRTVHEHQAGNTRSDLKFKVALREKAHSVYTGLIRIDEDAAVCEAYQENRNLILSPDAKAETIPELEILNHEVRCSHGATVGRIDDLEVFYLESRGISHTEAIRLIVSGFVGPIADRLPEVVRGRLSDVILKRLEGI